MTSTTITTANNTPKDYTTTLLTEVELKRQITQLQKELHTEKQHNKTHLEYIKLIEEQFKEFRSLDLKDYKDIDSDFWRTIQSICRTTKKTIDDLIEQPNRNFSNEFEELLTFLEIMNDNLHKHDLWDMSSKLRQIIYIQKQLNKN